MKREKKRRFTYIETCLYWGNGLTAQQLGDTFGIARQNAQSSIDAYRKLHPENLIYNPSKKRHEATNSFAANYITLKSEAYMNYLRGNSLSNKFWEDEDWNGLPVEDVDSLFHPHTSVKTTRKLINAIENQQALDIEYHAKAVTQTLSVALNQLVYSSRRYHFRAYCFNWEKFIDLVPSRILDIGPSHEDWVSSDEDEEWNTFIILSFKPNPELPDQLKKTLLLDYQLENGEKYVIKTRKALRGYVLREMERLDWKHRIPLWLLSDSK